MRSIDYAADDLVSAWEKLDAVGLDGLPPVGRVGRSVKYFDSFRRCEK